MCAHTGARDTEEEPVLSKASPVQSPLGQERCLWGRPRVTGQQVIPGAQAPVCRPVEALGAELRLLSDTCSQGEARSGGRGGMRVPDGRGAPLPATPLPREPREADAAPRVPGAGSPASIPRGSGEHLIGLASLIAASHSFVSRPRLSSWKPRARAPTTIQAPGAAHSPDSYFWKHEGEQKSYALSRNNAFLNSSQFSQK